MRKVNDQKIYKHKYYPIYYDRKLKLNLVPISYYTREQAKLTLEKQFDKEVFKELKIIKGSLAIKKGLEFGKNAFYYKGKSHQVKKYYIPEEYSYNRSRRRTFIKRLRRLNKNNQPSGVKRLLRRYFTELYGTK